MSLSSNLSLLSCSATTALAMTAVAWAQTSPEPNERLEAGAIPDTGFLLIPGEQGPTLLSTNGRWMVSGQLQVVDLWNRTVVGTPAELRATVSTLALDHLPDAELFKLTLGDGPQRAMVFVDPHCLYCQTYTARLNELTDEVLERTRIDLVPVPLLGEASVELVQRLECLAQRDARLALKIVLQHAWSSLSVVPADCGGTKTQGNLALASMLGVESVPYSIAASGALIQGLPASLNQLLDTGT